MRSKLRRAKWPSFGPGLTKMEKNSAPRLPRWALSRLRLPTSLGSVEPMSKPSSRKRWGVSAWVSTTMADSWMARALALTVMSGGFVDWATAGETARIRHDIKRILQLVIELEFQRVAPWASQ